MAETALLPKPVDTSGGDDNDENHVACDKLNLTWCGLDSTHMIPITDPDDLPPLETFCRVCVLAIEMHQPGELCPVCRTPTCLS